MKIFKDRDEIVMLCRAFAQKEETYKPNEISRGFYIVNRYLEPRYLSRYGSWELAIPAESKDFFWESESDAKSFIESQIEIQYERFRLSDPFAFKELLERKRKNT